MVTYWDIWQAKCSETSATATSGYTRMRHTLNAEGHGIRIRPVCMTDAPFIVWLRNLDHAKGNLGDSATNVVEQRTWLENYFERAGDYYFLAETIGGVSVGMNGIYDHSGTAAEGGRFVVSPGVPAAFPISILTYDLAFERLGLSELRATSVASNRMLHSYVRKLGFRQVRVEPAGRIIGGKPVDILHFLLKADDWKEARMRLLPLAQYAEEQILEWDNKSSEPSATVGSTIP